MSGIKLKICGVQNADEAKSLTDVGVRMVGINFVPTSARRISLRAAKTIMTEIQGCDAETVLLFQDQPLEDVKKAAEILKPDYIQLHGNEDAKYMQQVDLPIIKAIPVKEATTSTQVQSYINSHPADFYLLDREIQGSGNMVSLKLAKDIAINYPDKIYIAGGINPQNIESVAKAALPYGIDIAGGVRTGSRIDISKVKECLANLQGLKI